MNKDEKAAVIDRVAGQIEAADAILAVDYRGLSVSQASALRSSLREADTTFQIVKNTLTKRAADQAGAEDLKPFLVGPTALAFVRGDVAMAAKALARVRRELGVLEWKGGQMDGQPLTPDEIETIAKLPARDVLHAQLVGMIATPLTGLVRGLGSMISGLASQLEQIREQGLVGGEQGAGSGEQETAAASEEPAAEAEEPAPEPEEAPGDPVAEGEAAEAEETSETSDTPSEGEGTEEG